MLFEAWGSVFVDQGFASFYQAFCYKISWNCLKFRRMKSGHSLIPNLNPSSSDKLYVSNGVFLCKNEPVLLNFFGGGGSRPPPPYHLHYSYTVLNKRKNERGTNKESHLNDIFNPITDPLTLCLFLLVEI